MVFSYPIFDNESKRRARDMVSLEMLIPYYYFFLILSSRK